MGSFTPTRVFLPQAVGYNLDIECCRNTHSDIFPFPISRCFHGRLAERKVLEEHIEVLEPGLEPGQLITIDHIGIGKLDFLEAEHGDAVPVMRAIKQALDPLNVLNPGKVLRA